MSLGINDLSAYQSLAPILRGTAEVGPHKGVDHLLKGLLRDAANRISELEEGEVRFDWRLAPTVSR